MPTKGDSLPTVWNQPPHTKVKHDILTRYLAAWFGIFGSSRRHSAVNVLDGFAGPGCYEDGEPGSPVLALNTLLNHQSFGNFDTTRFTFVFNEWDPQRFASLREVLAEAKVSKSPWPANVHVLESNQNFQDLARQLLDSVGPNKQLAPTFAFIDPFGYRDVPMSTIRDLVSHRSCELFIYFDFNSDKLNPAALKVVDEAAAEFKKRGRANITLAGHTDKSGSSAYNQRLSKRRADAVLSGHAHTYERIQRDGIVHFVNGLGGAERYDFGAPVEGKHVLIFDDMISTAGTDKMIVYGGSDGTAYADNVLTYDPVANAWENLGPAGSATPRRRCSTRAPTCSTRTPTRRPWCSLRRPRACTPSGRTPT